MMKTTMTALVAAGAIALVPQASQAATFVQSDNEIVLRGFDQFDATLGTLDKVTLAINIYKARSWMVHAFDATTPSVDIGWTVDGEWKLNSGSPIGDVTLALAGTGTSTVPLTRSTAGFDYGYLEVVARGSALLDLAPALFTNGRMLFNGRDQGFSGGGSDTRFDRGDTRYVKLDGSCGLNFDGSPRYLTIEDYCGSTSYTLTYHYSPTGAVPEPATWAMMLAGFAAVGIALRRRRGGGTATV